ncbi:uncharacterized protein [Periplaneta americana]|uniref:uncharacterized protein n=1 Tax=Periplaneta americana TaxID=6978 RepID=UPI0037E78EAB
MYLNVHWILLFMVIAVHSARYTENLENYLQPDRISRDDFLYPPPGSNLCARECIQGAPPMTCYYKWIAEDYVTLGPECGDCPNTPDDCDRPQCVVGDGNEKSILAINRMVPGPIIEVCLGDRVIVDLQNNMAGAQTAIHWHGVFQKNYQYMDGVPMITQCSINEGTSFRYDFRANNEGTHYWHSHDGLQKLDGLQGNLVIATPKSGDPNGNLYDFDLPEHVLMILDWLNNTAEERFPGNSVNDPGQDPISFLLNGKGRRIAPTGQPPSNFPFQEVFVQRGKRYRLRLVSGLCTVCGVEFSIQDHSMTLIATDGVPVNPVSVNSIVMFSGERYDVVVNANQQAGSYWIHMRGLSECSEADRQVYQLGVLRYEGTNEALLGDPGYYPLFARSGTVANPENATCGSGQGGVCVSQLKCSIPDTENVINGPPDVNIVQEFTFNVFNKTTFFNAGSYQRYLVAPDRNLVTSCMNNISFLTPPSPILSQGQQLPSNVFCPLGRTGVPQCPASAASQGYCECVHVYKIPLGAVTQIVLGDGSPIFDLQHPFHLHGYDFYVMALDQYRNGETLDSVVANLKYRYRDWRTQVPARKDSIAVPSNGYAVIRFKANNPGLWFLHCHFMYHLATGMAIVLQVGEAHDWPPVPPNFPTCGNYQPGVYEDYHYGYDYPNEINNY